MDTCSRLLGSMGSFFGASDQIPWSTAVIITQCEQEVAQAQKNESEEHERESIMQLSWALVHSRKLEDIQRGIAMLDVQLKNHALPDLEKLYLLAVGHYRSGHYSMSRDLVEQCLEINPDWRQALFLKKTIEDRIAKDGFIGIGITATAVGLLVGGIAAALARKK